MVWLYIVWIIPINNVKQGGKLLFLQCFKERTITALHASKLNSKNFNREFLCMIFVSKSAKEKIV